MENRIAPPFGADRTEKTLSLTSRHTGAATLSRSMRAFPCSAREQFGINKNGEGVNARVGMKMLESEKRGEPENLWEGIKLSEAGRVSDVPKRSEADRTGETVKD
jgi:hypothetical protein